MKNGAGTRSVFLVPAPVLAHDVITRNKVIHGFVAIDDIPCAGRREQLAKQRVRRTMSCLDACKLAENRRASQRKVSECVQHLVAYALIPVPESVRVQYVLDRR